MRDTRVYLAFQTVTDSYWGQRHGTFSNLDAILTPVCLEFFLAEAKQHRDEVVSTYYFSDSADFSRFYCSCCNSSKSIPRVLDSKQCDNPFISLSKKICLRKCA